MASARGAYLQSIGPSQIMGRPAGGASIMLEEKKDDGGVKSGAGNAAWNPLNEVDSALLSALCDGRERKSLFRLEQVMVDFMRDKSCVYMDVGGSGNSIVLKQDSGSENSSSNGELLEGQSPASQQGLQELQYQQQRGLRQTSFQRLILHRLADRFNVMREQVPVGTEQGLVNVGGQQSFSQGPGLIRLVKMEESCIPSHLLIDIDLSVLVNYKNPRARNNNVGGIMNINTAPAVASSSSNHENHYSVGSLSEQMASTALEGAPLPTATGTKASKKSKKKMVIMKRNSSNGNGDNPDGKGKKKGKARRKKLEDREKAYEEARARIFGGKSESSGIDINDGDDNAKNKGGDVPQSADSQDNGATMNSCHSSLSLENDVTSPTSPSAASPVECEENTVPSQLISAATAPSTEQRLSPSSSELKQDWEEPVSSSPVAGGAEAEASRQPSFSSSNASAPAAVTVGAVSKAVYRNRQQEENDPDFKRRSDVRPTYVPYVTTNPYGPPIGGNPYAAMGQQPPPPQMIPIHVQQQASQHPPQYYHGQPNPQQFPTPQDASYAQPNVANNNPPPQWVAQGYFPSQHPPPPQQQNYHGQEEQKNSQASWPQAHQKNPSQQMQQQVQFNTAPTPKSSTQPQQTKQPPVKILWGSGARGSDSSTMSDAAANQSGCADIGEGTSPRMASTRGQENAAVYKPEDFPALR